MRESQTTASTWGLAAVCPGPLPLPPGRPALRENNVSVVAFAKHDRSDTNPSFPADAHRLGPPSISKSHPDSRTRYQSIAVRKGQTKTTAVVVLPPLGLRWSKEQSASTNEPVDKRPRRTLESAVVKLTVPPHPHHQSVHSRESRFLIHLPALPTTATAPSSDAALVRLPRAAPPRHHCRLTCAPEPMYQAEERLPACAPPLEGPVATIGFTY